MTLEDSDAHARRNVVLLSASMLLAAWLKQDLPGMLAAIGVSHFRPETAQRVWAALFVLMLYLVARYHFSPDRKARWTAGAKVVHDLQHRWLAQWCRECHAGEINRRKAEKRSAYIPISPDVFEIPWLTLHGWREVHYKFQRADEDDEEFDARYQDDSYELGQLPWWRGLLNAAASFVVRMLLSRDGLEVAVPYWLAVTALLVAALKAGWFS
ncbi:hypothetical protein ACLQ8Z_06105 [Bordetella hinzii]|uniref:hypothetical protein n=1 Tax=Bordetella hinzii TaxID=103855 RepID=UPI001239F0F0|nr:hypothetical protein [Bordetella hinzii]MBZ0073635.1 hypothetical protein [Bordetella hinzii]MBZ0077889.1 hypothetical protein [Bordetella hinzii]MBZ0082432.1 hypothetical protein [Bordetella hinzii]QET42182.1 hypothetical protein FOB29_00435 [Bordetella hinzii]